MKSTILSLLMIISVTIATSHTALAGRARENNRKEVRRVDRSDRFIRAPLRKKTIVVTPRRRTFRNIVIVRPYGHSYHGYGHFYHDNDAWKWLAFTAITLKMMDNINEQAQRAHEAAQVKAVTAPIGEKIIWSEGDSSGSVVATKEGKDSTSGFTCREFQQTITVGENSENAFGTACLQADGVWKIIQ